MKRKPPAGNVRRVRAIENNIRYTITNKTGRVVQCESHMERKLVLQLERDPSVQDYASQPEELTWQDAEGNRHHYVPDFMVWCTDGRIELHEVTLTIRQDRAHNQARQVAAQTICQARGWRYVVHVETVLPQDTEVANLMMLYMYRPTVYANDLVIESTLAYLQAGRLPLGTLSRALAQQTGLGLPVIYGTLFHLLWQNKLKTNLQTLLFTGARLAEDAEIWLEAGQ